ncbi:hypothetical protein AC578_7939 [Pseudocercospora eumusae]|uniref:DUF7587 domain-containing protein n=1 Tax=Pseudocercospora eumusae TaxID=321146 RepID=A0A139HPD0_9PEZI|nr:hypothetical protein AC578_7939 [Pseudocercospora eumusae]
MTTKANSNEFDARGETRAKIFNSIFADEIAAGGYANGIGANALSSQWGEREKKPYWRAVIEPDNPRNAPLRDSVRAQIRAAVGLGGSILQQSRRATSSTSQPQATPLSKRPAIACWAPEQADEDGLRQSSPKRRRLEGNLTPGALIPVIPQQEYMYVLQKATVQKATVPHTPPTTPKAPSKKKQAVKRIQTPKTTVVRNDGTTIKAGDKTIKRMERPLEPIPEQLARAPMPGLFFRCWDKKTPNDHNSEDGFWARLYHKSNVIDIEPFITHFWVYNHIDKKPPGTELLKSPYISVSSGLIWLLRKSLKQAAKGESHQRVSVISSKVLNSKAVFWVPPLHASTLGPAPYHGAAQYYTGKVEWLCWRDIPGPAIIRTFSLQQLRQFCHENKNVGSLLRLAKLTIPGYASMRRALEVDEVALNLQSTTAIADLAIFMGIDGHACMTHIQALVCEVIWGCCLQLTYHTEEEWQSLASAFSQALIKAAEGFNNFGQQVKIEHAFLEGIFWACGEVNPKTTKEKTDRNARKAGSLGLNPLQIITKKLDSIKMSLAMETKASMKRVKNYHRKLPAIEDSEDADSAVAGPSRRLREVFEFGDDGLVLRSM